MLSCVPLPLSLLWEPLPFLARQEASRKAGGHPKLPGRDGTEEAWQKEVPTMTEAVISLVLPKGSHSEQADFFFLSLIHLLCLLTEREPSEHSQR